MSEYTSEQRALIYAIIGRKGYVGSGEELRLRVMFDKENFGRAYREAYATALREALEQPAPPV